MAKKFYAVRAGRKTGIFASWAECNESVNGYSRAEYKSFDNKLDAESFLTNKPPKPKPSRSTGNYSVELYTDGAAKNNPGLAGAGFCIYKNNELQSAYYGGFEEQATNNRMELLAIKHSLIFIKPLIQQGQSTALYSDSEYSVKGITKYSYKWKLKDFTTKAGEKRPNHELMKWCHDFYNTHKANLHIEHVRAHQGIEGNEIADRMSILAINRAQTDFAQYENNDISKILNLSSGG